MASDGGSSLATELGNWKARQIRRQWVISGVGFRTTSVKLGTLEDSIA